MVNNVHRGAERKDVIKGHRYLLFLLMKVLKYAFLDYFLYSYQQLRSLLVVERRSPNAK